MLSNSLPDKISILIESITATWFDSSNKKTKCIELNSSKIDMRKITKASWYNDITSELKKQKVSATWIKHTLKKLVKPKNVLYECEWL